jgi:hypothetical protein
LDGEGGVGEVLLGQLGFRVDGIHDSVAAVLIDDAPHDVSSSSRVRAERHPPVARLEERTTYRGFPVVQALVWDDTEGVPCDWHR